MVTGNPIEVIRQAVTHWVDRVLDSMPGPGKPLVPVNVLEDGLRTTQSFPELIQNWLSGPGPAIAILSGPLGSGKTAATCLLYRALSQQRDGDQLDLWVPMRIVEPSASPLLELFKALGVEGPAGPLQDAPLRCLILDGVDEFAYRCSAQQLHDWFSRLCWQLKQVRSKPRLLLSGRDVVFSSHSALTEVLSRFSASSSRPASGALRRFELEPWSEERYREQLAGLLEERLRDRFQESTSTEVHRRLERVAHSVLTSPLFYALACEYLSNPDASAELLENQRQLMHHWILRILDEQWATKGTMVSTEERLQAAIGISAYLVLSGRGMAGATLQELANEETLRRIWAHLRSQPDSTPGVEDSSLDPGFVLALRELKHTTLMSCRGDHYAPFHEQVLIHLAAEGMERISAVRPNPADDSELGT